MRRTPLTTLWLAAGMGFVALVVYLSINTEPIDVGRVEDVKVGHFIAYGWLMLWFCQVYRTLRTRVVLAAALVLLGVALEYVQGWTGYRSFAYSDMRDDALGVAIGWILSLTPLKGFLEALEVRYSLARKEA